jgi:hypothetical protein
MQLAEEVVPSANRIVLLVAATNGNGRAKPRASASRHPVPVHL